MEKMTSRRGLLTASIKGAAAFMAAFAIGPTLLTACKNSLSAENSKGPPIDKKIESSSSCPNQKSLTDQEKSIRSTLKYVDHSPIAVQTCDNCKLYTAATHGAPCGACTVVPGPIHPKGHCTAWLQKM